jgi:nucleotide-binding universal stress UspA family protein
VLSIDRILVPVLDTESFRASRCLLNQIAWLAHQFHSEVILLHVVSAFDHPVGLLEPGNEITVHDPKSNVVQAAVDDLAHMAPPELGGIAVTRILLRGAPAREILQTAVDRKVEMIAMPTPNDPAFFSFLTCSITKRLLSESTCPIWVGAHLEEAPDEVFCVRRILCSVDLTPHSRRILEWAAVVAAATGATLTLVHITSGVEVWGPGGTHIDPEWKNTLVGIAREEIEKLQCELGTSAEVVIDSGNVPELLNRAAESTRADILVVGRIPGRSHIGDNGDGYGIIRESRIPVLSV